MDQDRVGAVVARLRALVDGLPAGDGVAVFAGVYLTVTEAVLDHLAAGDLFGRPDRVTALDVRFAGMFLDALTAPRPPACWRPLLELRGRPGVQRLQFALSGMNAHIEHDLPLAVVGSCTALGCCPAELHQDFQRVNDLLAGVEKQIRVALLPEEPAVAEPLLHLLGDWGVEQARGAAWISAEALWELRDHPAAFAVASSALDDATGAVSRLLLRPTAEDTP